MAFLNANWGSNPDDGKSMSLCVVMLSNFLVNFKVGMQEVTTQSTTETNLAAAALTMKESVFWLNVMKELKFDTLIDNLLAYIDFASALHVAGNQTYSSRIVQLFLRCFFF